MYYIRKCIANESVPFHGGPACIYFAALNENWDFTHCDKLEIGLVILFSEVQLFTKILILFQ